MRPVHVIEAAFWLAAFTVLAILFAGCSGFRGGIRQVDAVTTAESWGRHHARLLLGPRALWAGGASIHAYGGRQFAVYEPSEPHVSSRAPSDEWQGGVECSVPLWRRP